MVQRGGSVRGGVFGLIGWPLEHSLSPAMHTAAFAHAGVDATYVLRPTEPAALADVVDDVRSGALAGANVTVPHKLAVRSHLDSVSDLVEAIGATNTLVRAPNGLHGDNTDVVGFRHALEAAEVAAAGAGRAVVLGAGGAARAVVYVLLDAGWHVTVLNRSSGVLGVLGGTMHRAFSQPRLATAPLDVGNLLRRADDADLLVNATPIGSGSDTRASPWPDATDVPTHLTIIDLVAWPIESRFVMRARRDGARAHGGLEMLIGQAAATWTLWTDRPAPIDVMRAAAYEARGRISPSCHSDS